MPDQFGGRFCRHQDVAVLVTDIALAEIGAPRSVFMVQPQHASRNRITAGLLQGESPFRNQGVGCLARHANQAIGIDRVSRGVVIGLILTECGAQQYEVPSGDDPRD
jgi:hypothetical protein